jgi:plasmid stability protein
MSFDCAVFCDGRRQQRHQHRAPPRLRQPQRGDRAEVLALTALNGGVMATITVRNLPTDVQRKLKRRAAEHNRSMEAEARAILGAAVAEDGFGTAWLQATAAFRGGALDVPERSEPRPLDLS